MQQIVYAIFREAVYRHECVGIFATEENARIAATGAIEREPDAHHEITIVPFPLGQVAFIPAPPDKYGWCGDSPTQMEPAPIFSGKKVK